MSISAEDSDGLLGSGDAARSSSPPAQPAEPAARQDPARPDRRQQLEQRIRERTIEIDLYLELAAIHRAEDRPLEAKRVLHQALQLNEADPRVLWHYEEAVLARSLQQLREVAQLAARLNTPEVQRELDRAQTDWANRRLDVCRARLARDPEKHHYRLVMAEAFADLGLHEQACESLTPCFAFDAHAPAARLLQGNCLSALADDLGALTAYRAAALRRTLHIPPKIRGAAMRAAAEIAQRLGLTLSQQRYLHALESAEAELAEEAVAQPTG